MPPTDRAFRALGREDPGALVDLLPAAGLSWGALTPLEVRDPNLDSPPHPVEADFVARGVDGTIVHMECQRYRDPTSDGK